MTYNTHEFFEPEWIDQKLAIPDIDSNLICTEIALDAILYFNPDEDVEKLIKLWEKDLKVGVIRHG